MCISDSEKADIAVVFHLSSKTKVPQINQHFVPFLETVLEEAKIDQGDIRVSLTNFAKRPRIRVGTRN